MTDNGDDERSTNAELGVEGIGGIGSKRRRWLSSSFAVHTIGDLARLDPEVVAERLAAAGDPAGARAAPAWIDEARRAVAADRSRDTGDEIGGGFDPGADWRPFAAFVIEVQVGRREFTVETMTFVHHVEADLTRSWPGIVPAAVGRWIDVQAREALDDILGRPDS